MGRVLGNDPNDGFEVPIREFHSFGPQLRVVLNEAFDELDVVVLAVNRQIVFAIDVDLDLEEGFEIFDVTVVRSEKLGDAVADPNAFFHLLRRIITWSFAGIA